MRCVSATKKHRARSSHVVADGISLKTWRFLCSCKPTLWMQLADPVKEIASVSGCPENEKSDPEESREHPVSTPVE